VGGGSGPVAENIRAQNRLRDRETIVHAIVTQIPGQLVRRGTGQTPSEVLQRLTLELDAWLGQPGPPEQHDKEPLLLHPRVPPH
jgi:hypothetical protein